MQVAAAGVRSPVPIFQFQFPFSEADLSRLWEGQTFPPEALTTITGERLRVVYRGRRTGGPGPDFRDALIAAPDGLLPGDVELHVRSSDFRRHGHHLDGAYESVVLHVVFRCDEPGPTPLPGGDLARVVALEEWVEGRALEIKRWLERPALWREPCRSVVGRNGTASVEATLDRLGDMRFRARAAALARRLAGEEPDQLLWGELLEGLGYGGERELYRSLAIRAPWREICEEMLNAPVSERAAEAYRRLAEASAGVVTRSGRPTRPANRPQNRVKGAAALAARFADTGPMGYFSGLLEAPDVERLVAALTVPAYVGRSRAIELLANAVLPCLAGVGPDRLARVAEGVYGRLPLPVRYGAVRHLHEAAAGLGVDFRRQQGMLYLLKQYCTQGGCGRCPLS
jgi:hypothetical protein